MVDISLAVDLTLEPSDGNSKDAAVSAHSCPAQAVAPLSTSEDQESEANQCCICSEPWHSSGPRRVVALRGCGHLFCHECIKEWFSNKGTSAVCPVCRKKCGFSALVSLHAGAVHSVRAPCRRQDAQIAHVCLQAMAHLCSFTASHPARCVQVTYKRHREAGCACTSSCRPGCRQGAESREAEAKARRGYRSLEAAVPRTGEHLRHVVRKVPVCSFPIAAMLACFAKQGDSMYCSPRPGQAACAECTSTLHTCCRKLEGDLEQAVLQGPPPASGTAAVPWQQPADAHVAALSSSLGESTKLVLPELVRTPWQNASTCLLREARYLLGCEVCLLWQASARGLAPILTHSRDKHRSFGCAMQNYKEVSAIAQDAKQGHVFLGALLPNFSEKAVLVKQSLHSLESRAEICLPGSRCWDVAAQADTIGGSNDYVAAACGSGVAVVQARCPRLCFVLYLVTARLFDSGQPRVLQRKYHIGTSLAITTSCGRARQCDSDPAVPGKLAVRVQAREEHVVHYISTPEVNNNCRAVAWRSEHQLWLSQKGAVKLFDMRQLSREVAGYTTDDTYVHRLCVAREGVIAATLRGSYAMALPPNGTVWPLVVRGMPRETGGTCVSVAAVTDSAGVATDVVTSFRRAGPTAGAAAGLEHHTIRTLAHGHAPAVQQWEAGGQVHGFESVLTQARCAAVHVPVRGESLLALCSGDEASGAVRVWAARQHAQRSMQVVGDLAPACKGPGKAHVRHVEATALTTGGWLVSALRTQPLAFAEASLTVYRIPAAGDAPVT